MMFKMTTMKSDSQKWRKFCRSFFFPRLDCCFLLRLLLLAVSTYLLVRHLCQPAWTNGESMLPTYQKRQFLLCWKPAYWFSSPQPGDVVIIRLAGTKVMLLKRVVAQAGDKVEFRQGVLLVNGQPLSEPWVSATGCDWELPERVVEEGCVYVVGDNRNMEILNHEFGQVAIRRIAGRPLSFCPLCPPPRESCK